MIPFQIETHFSHKIITLTFMRLRMRVFLSLVFFIPVSVQAQTKVSISENNDIMSIQANNVTAGELAASISDILGITVVVAGDEETQVNVDIVEEPIDKALSKLSPNNMLVRDANNEKIIEFVLMVGDEQANNAPVSEQFLPSGSPAEPVLTQDTSSAPEQNAEPTQPRDSSRAATARQAADSASSDAGVPPPQEPPIDPATNLPNEQ